MRLSGTGSRIAPVSGLMAVLMVAALFLTSLQGVFAQDSTPEPTEVTVVHAQGETVVPYKPEVVISFDLASVDTLDTLGVEISGLPKATPLQGRFEKFNSDDYEDVGTLFEPDYEAVAALEPGLIIVANRSAATLPELSKIAPTIDLTGQTGDVIADLTTSVNILAEIFGKQEEAAAALAAIDEQVAALQGAVGEGDTALVIMTSGGSVTALAPGGIRGGLIYGTLGFPPPVDDVEQATHGEAISFEFLLETNPTWLFVIDRDAGIGAAEGEAAEVVLDNAIVHETTAWQEGNIVYLDPFDWYIVMNGLTTVSNMLGELAPVLGED